MIRILRLSAAAAFGIALAASIHRPAAAEQVHCYDAARGALSYVGRTACAHEIVSPERAQAIKDARRDYIRRSMQQPDPVPSPSRYKSFGSGFFVHPAGYVVSNHHVVARCGGVSILNSAGAEVPAKLIASAPREDLALLKVSGAVKAYAPVSNGNPAAGDPVTIAGFPVLKLPRREPMVMRGSYLGEETVSNRGRILVLDALVWQGSSGSPAFDRFGRVTGVVFAKANIPGIFLRSGREADDRTYAVPARVLTAFLRQHGVKPVTARPDGKPLESMDALVRINCLP